MLISSIMIFDRSNLGNSITSSRLTSPNDVSSTLDVLGLGLEIFNGVASVLGHWRVWLVRGDIESGSVTNVYLEIYLSSLVVTSNSSFLLSSFTSFWTSPWTCWVGIGLASWPMWTSVLSFSIVTMIEKLKLFRLWNYVSIFYPLASFI